MAVGRASGENRAVEAVQQAVSSRLLDITIDGARGILFNITGGPDMSLFEVNEAASIIKQTAHPDVNLIFGAVIDEKMGDEVRITVVATGFDNAQPRGRTARVAREARTETVDAATEPVELSVPNFDKEDIEIPAFLRRRS
jgi:cell division protein FtsZ